MLDFNDGPQREAWEVARMGPEHDLDKLSRQLAQRAPTWIPEIFPNGRLSQDGKEWRLANIRGDAPKKEGSCVITLRGEHAGCWQEFDGGGGGGPLSTLKHATHLSGRALFERAAEIVGGTAAPKANGHDRRRRTEEDVAREIDFILRYCEPARGTPVETYLNARGLDLPDCPDLLFHPNLTDWEAKRGRPALVCVLRRPNTDAETGGIWRIYLADDGKGKANMPKAKMGLGPCAGGVAMLAPMGQDGALGIAEGVETALAAMQIFGIPTWAGLSASGVTGFVFPPGLRELTIFSDRGNGGEKAAWDLYKRAIAAGIDVFVVLPKSDDDFNKDLILGCVVSDYQPEQLPDHEVPYTAAVPKSGKPEGRGLPIVKVGGGSLPVSIDQAETILTGSDDGIFQRGDFVVRPAPVMVTIADNRKTSALRLVPVRVQHMRERFTRAVDFQKYNAKQRKWVSTDCPADVAAAYLERTGDWNLPVLSGIANAPMLRPDGSILDEPGYDSATGIMYDPRGVVYPPIPREPTKEDALAALALLKALISEFPFVPDDPADMRIDAPSASRSVALSGFLTAMHRRSLPAAPMHAFTAPAMGTGKSKLVDLASMIASGHEAPVLAQGKTEEEMEKRLGAALIAGDTMISFDNCEHPMGGELLCQALTQQALEIRILGKSVNKKVLSNAAFFATGNNLVVIGDMTRRTLLCSLDAKIERPETREFSTEDPVKVVRRDRAKYVVAALTILRAYHVAGRPKQTTTPLGSFEDWSNSVRDALVWLGEPDPCQTMERSRAEDPRRQELAAVLHQWHNDLGQHPVTVKELIERATTRYNAGSTLDLNPTRFAYPDLREALLVVAGDGGAINSRRLGTWLGRNKGKVVDGVKLAPATMQDGNKRWQVIEAV